MTTETITIKHGFDRGRYVVRGVPDGGYGDDGHHWPQQSYIAAQRIAERRAEELRKRGYLVDVREL